jgi:hypothetical protein
VLAECPEDFETMTVWSTLARMESDVSLMESSLSRSEEDCLAEIAANLTILAAVKGDTAHTAVQRAVKDRLMSG